MKKALFITILLTLLFFVSSIIILFGHSAYYKQVGAGFILWPLIIILSLLLIYIILKKENTIDILDTEFNELYNRLYSTYSNELEILRKRTVFKKTLRNIIFCSIILLYLFVIVPSSFVYIDKIGYLLPLVLLPIIYKLLCYISKRTNDEQNYINSFKENIISELIKLTNHDLFYNKEIVDNNEIINKYNKAQFEYSTTNNFIVDDVIIGKTDDNSELIMANLFIYNGRKSKEKEIFNGMFADVQINDIGNTIKIVPQNKDLYLNLFENKLTKVKMDSIGFENSFNVYSDNKILTMRILTSDTMILINDFYINTNIKTEIILTKNHIYLRFFTGSLFEPKSIKDTLNKKTIYMYYKIFKIIFDFSRKVNDKIAVLDI